MQRAEPDGGPSSATSAESKSWVSPEYESGLVSVIIPTYNRAHLVTSAMDCVRSQTYRPIELIVVDDGSTDDSEQVIQAWKHRNDESGFEVVYVRKPKNEKLAMARNTGIGRARGEFIALLDSDDEWMPTKLQRQVECLRRSSPTVGLVYTGAVMCFPGGRQQMQRPSHRGYLSRESLLGNVIVGSGSGVLVRREVFSTVGQFDPELPAGEDFDMWIRVLAEYEVEFLNECLVRIDAHDDPGRISNDAARKLDSADMIFEKHRRLFKAKNAESEYMRRVAWHCQYVMRDHALARRRYADAMRLSPFSPWSLVGLLSTLLPHGLLRRLRGTM
jgi:glycosyltransferase involved in cell wall biosynthesis